MVKEMSLVNDDHRFEMMKATQVRLRDAAGVWRLLGRIWPEPRTHSKSPLIEMTRSQFGVEIEDLEALLIEQILEPADGGCFTGTHTPVTRANICRSAA